MAKRAAYGTKEVYKSKDGIWYYPFQIRGKGYHAAIPEARTKYQAKRAAQRARQEVFEDKYGWEPSSITLAEFVKSIFLPWARSEKRSWRNDESRSKPLFQAFGKKRMRDIGDLAVRSYRKERLACELAGVGHVRRRPLTVRFNFCPGCPALQWSGGYWPRILVEVSRYSRSTTGSRAT